MREIEALNKAAAVNAPIALLFRPGHRWRRVTEQQRWASAVGNNDEQGRQELRRHCPVGVFVLHR